MTQLLAQVTEVESLTKQVLQRSGNPNDMSSWENGRLHGPSNKMYDIVKELFDPINTIIH